MINRFVEEFNPESADIAICSSMSFQDSWLKIGNEIISNGLTISTPDISESININWNKLTQEEIIQKKGYYIRRHLANIATAKAVLICNYKKNETDNYIGSNTFLEMTAAYVYGKPIYILNKLPKEQNNYEELLAMNPIILNGNIDSLVKDIKL